MSTARFAFVSTMAGDPWGGSEELWARTAKYFASAGISVAASVAGWSPPHDRIVDLARSGVDIWSRPTSYSLVKKAWRRSVCGDQSDTALEVEKFIAKKRPSLIVLSDGGPFPPLELLELCAARRVPFVVIGHANSNSNWLDDLTAKRYRDALQLARRYYCVSRANLELAKRQLGFEVPSGEVVRNPFNVDFSISPVWPKLRFDDELRLACVGRLHLPSKGQDLLIEALAQPVWSDRNWRLTLYGSGPMQDIVERLITRFGIGRRVEFGGQIAPKEIWAKNHVLVMPSRYEGLPLAMVEAMLCARPVVATDVAGHSEIVEDGVTGFLAEAPTVKALLQSLEKLWNTRATLEQMGNTAAVRIRELVPEDPIVIFAHKLSSLLAGRSDVPHCLQDHSEGPIFNTAHE